MFEDLGAGEGNRTIVFSLEGTCAASPIKPLGDKSAVFGPLKGKSFLFLSERR
jgi:hypothetical protein